MSRDFETWSACTTRQRDRGIRELGKMYAYGWRREEGDGRVRWVIDEVRGKEDETKESSRDRRGEGSGSESGVMLPPIRRMSSF